MITEFVARFEAHRLELANKFRTTPPKTYLDLVTTVITAITDETVSAPDPGRIHEIDDGAYKGEFIYLIAEKCYSPRNYWYVMVRYGSCTGCDTLQGIQNDKSEESRVADYMSLALHLVQGITVLPRIRDTWE